MRVLVCGGRDYNDRDAVARALRAYKPLNVVTDVSDAILILGGAPGADTLAEEWADVFGLRKRIFPANWAKHGRAAGPIRNQQMLDEGKPDLVIAFPGGRGTADMVSRAEKAGVRVIRVPATPQGER
ncbi:MAG: SLOG family protein [Proteobacteria bacterium]|nr:SLOG family protein [Pseudomonadota bacterium]